MRPTGRQSQIDTRNRHHGGHLKRKSTAVKWCPIECQVGKLAMSVESCCTIRLRSFQRLPIPEDHAKKLSLPSVNC